MSFLTGSSNSIHKFGLADSASSLTSIPKMTDLWYVKIYDVNRQNLEVRHKNVKSVSDINIQFTTQTVDSYGKRIHVPTRVDFPPVTLTFYDTMDGTIFRMAREAYEYQFGNNTLNDQSDYQAIVDPAGRSGRVAANSPMPHINFFRKFELWHMTTGTRFDKTVIINPIITSISFSDSNYQSSDVRTVTIQMDPENIIIRENVTDDSVPSWVKKNNRKGTS